MRKFLVVLDDSRECLNAMRFAAMRASRSGGKVTILSVIPPRRIPALDGRPRSHACRSQRENRGPFRGLRQMDADPQEYRSRTRHQGRKRSSGNSGVDSGGSRNRGSCPRRRSGSGRPRPACIQLEQNFGNASDPDYRRAGTTDQGAARIHHLTGPQDGNLTGYPLRR